MPDPRGLEAHALACRRGARLVLEAVSFSLRPGDALLVAGPNGSGKSTLLRVLAGFLPPAGGELAWDGESLQRDPAGWRARCHYVGHQNALKPALQAGECVALAAGLLGGDGERTAAALDALGLGALASTEVRLLSAGQKRRLALARLVAARRPLWLLDEPAAGLDRASRDALECLIREHRAGGGIVVAAAHGDLTLDDSQILDLS